MIAKRPADRRKFAGRWDEIGYLYDKLLYWLYQRGDAAKARPFAERLRAALRAAPDCRDGIFANECWSLVFETLGDVTKAIDYRENEIRLIRRLHAISRGTAGESAVMRHYGY